jgi:hypothetical protein
VVPVSPANENAVPIQEESKPSMPQPEIQQHLTEGSVVPSLPADVGVTPVQEHDSQARPQGNNGGGSHAGDWAGGDRGSFDAGRIG